MKEINIYGDLALICHDVPRPFRTNGNSFDDPICLEEIGNTMKKKRQA